MPPRFTLFTRSFWLAALHRAIRSAAQGALATIGTTALFFDVHWVAVGSGALLMAVLSLLTSIATDLPEADEGQSVWVTALVAAAVCLVLLLLLDLIHIS